MHGVNLCLVIDNILELCTDNYDIIAVLNESINIVNFSIKR